MTTVTTAEIVTPALAAQWLARNHPHNRFLSPGIVRSMAATMRAGGWLDTGESIKLAEDGTLIDGQHRVSAVVAAGVPVLLSVTRGVPADAMIAIDSGRSRDATARLVISGTAVDRGQVACCLVIHQVTHLAPLGARVLPAETVRAMVQTWLPHIDAMRRILGHVDAEKRPTRGAPVLGALAAMRPLDPECIDALAGRLYSGQQDSRGEADPARALRRRIAASPAGAQSARWRLTLETLRAAEADMSGERVSLLRAAPDAHIRVLRRLQAAGLAPKEDG